jgi:CHAT domain-containing protein/tetratricopeptide (TPR) repeat protein
MKNRWRLALLICTSALLPPVQGPLIAQPAVAPLAPAPPEVVALILQGHERKDAYEWEESLRLYNEALTTARNLDSKVGEAAALYNIGSVYSPTGQPQQALRFYEQALPLWRQIGGKLGEATTLDGIGLVYAKTGQLQQALRFYEEALRLFRQVSDKSGEATVLSNIGVVYSVTGQPQQALRFYEQALPLSKQIGDKSGEASTLSNIGLVYENTGQPQQALRFYEQALPLWREVGDKSGEATTLNNIGVVYAKTGQPQQALRFYEQALPLSKQIGDKSGEASTLANIGAVYSSTGQPQQALRFYEQALRLFRQVGDKSSEAATLGNLGTVEEAQGRLPHADKHFRAALNILEDMRERLGGSSQNKVSFLESHLHSYHNYINFLLKQKNPVSAFDWAQKTKARALVDLMGSGRVDISRGLSSKEQEQEREMKWRVGQANQQLLDAAMQPNSDDAQVSILKAKLAQAGQELEHFTNSLYARNESLSFKRAARTTTLSETATFLPADTALLEYVVLKTNKLDKVILFCVTVEKDKSGKAKAVVQAYPINRTFKQLSERLEDFRVACSDSNREYEEKALDLYKLLLAPAAQQLKSKKRLLICPDGPLWGTPFQALMMPGTAQSKPGLKPQFLIQSYEISYAYSATGAQAALKAANERRRKPGGGGTLLALANPNFDGWGLMRGDTGAAPDPSDAATSLRPLTIWELMRGDTGAATDTSPAGNASPDPSGAATPQRPLTINLRPITLNLRSTNGTVVRRDGSIQPLPGTQLEADAIKKSFPGSKIFTGDKAQEAIVKQHAGNYSILHFATHGLFNEYAPLESGIVLAAPPSSLRVQAPPEQAAAEEDGLLRAREIFDLNLNADLVVLSACDTGRGQKQSGEGVVGLSWALFVAGAPTQVLSQWAVADQSTAQLMESFYSNLEAKKAKGVALRAASLALMKDGKHSHPFYWAPFVLLGDWR